MQIEKISNMKIIDGTLVEKTRDTNIKKHRELQNTVKTTSTSKTTTKERQVCNVKILLVVLFI